MLVIKVLMTLLFHVGNIGIPATFLRLTIRFLRLIPRIYKPNKVIN